MPNIPCDFCSNMTPYGEWPSDPCDISRRQTICSDCLVGKGYPLFRPKSFDALINVIRICLPPEAPDVPDIEKAFQISKELSEIRGRLEQTIRGLKWAEGKLKELEAHKQALKGKEVSLE